MTSTSIHFSSNSEDWSTPQDFFDRLDQEFHFTLDVCATSENAKCSKFYTKEQDGLHRPWVGNVCFMNPPYGRAISKWMEKAWLESDVFGATVVCLVPARTDTLWFHQWAMRGEVRLVRGRLKFGGSKSSAPFPSAVVVFRPGVQPCPLRVYAA